MAEELKPLNIEEWRDGLKQCPLCNTTKMLKVDIVGGLKVEGCDYCGIFVMKGHWNTRPIEEALELGAHSELHEEHDCVDDDQADIDERERLGRNVVPERNHGPILTLGTG